MKTITSLCCGLLLLTGLGPHARGESFRTDINPALLYYQAFLLAPELSAADNNYLVTNQWVGWQPLPDRFGSLMAGYQNELGCLKQAMNQKVPCDWGIDLSRGPETLLPHVALCKQAVIKAQWDIMWRLQQGDQAAARDDLLASLTLGRNTSRDRTLIGALVEIAIESVVCTTVAEDFGRFSPETLQQLAEGFEQAPVRGTLAAALATERGMHQDWLIGRVEAAQQAHPHDEAAVMEELHQEFIHFAPEMETSYWLQFTNGPAGTPDGVIKMAREATVWYERLAGLSTLPHGQFEEQFNQLSAEANKSGNIMFLRDLSGWSSGRQKEFRIQGQLAMVKAAVAYKLHGEAGLKSVNDPNGNGPFACKRFVFQGVDRGFQLTSPLLFSHAPMSCIFVEKDGPPFSVFGAHVGEAVTP